MTIRGKTLPLPILQGGMGVGVSLDRLAGAVAACGGMGTISTAMCGFREPDCWGYLPLIQLCVCWYRLGDTAKAVACNERAAELKPESRACAHNRAFFAAHPA